MDSKSWADGWIVEGDFMKSLLQDIGCRSKNKIRRKNEKAKVFMLDWAEICPTSSESEKAEL